MSLSTVILAAGQGKRMHSQTPKVLHRLAGKPILEHVVETASHLSDNQQTLVVFGHDGDKVQNALNHLNVHWVKQEEQLGTGHALQQALPQIQEEQRVLVLYGDVPLISQDTLEKLIATTPKQAIGILTATLTNPTGLGRIIRNSQNHIIGIVEEKDATDEQRQITEINTGVYLVPATYLKSWLPQLTNANAQKEYYLTDIIHFAVQHKVAICDTQAQNSTEILGVNDRLQLATLERCFQRQQAERLLKQGVTLYDPARFDLRGELSVGIDVIIDVNVIIEGRVSIGSHCTIGPNTVLRNVTIGDHTEIKANSLLDGATIADKCTVGPFARLRPETVLQTNSHIGNFVEIKKSIIGSGSKINHLSYIGDSDVGKNVNIGAGTITCNYDGVNKHRTTIGDHAFIGSNSQLIAPVTIGENATIGAGSTITRHAPSHQLTLCRAEQRSIANWKRPEKKES